MSAYLGPTADQADYEEILASVKDDVETSIAGYNGLGVQIPRELVTADYFLSSLLGLVGGSSEGGAFNGLTKAQLDESFAALNFGDLDGNTDQLETVLTAIDAKLAALGIELQGKADLTDTQPISAESLPLPALAATSTLQTDSNTKLDSLITNGGSTTDTPATSNTGSFSILSFLKRFLSHYFSTKQYISILASASNDTTAIAAPATGTRIVITLLRVQATVAEATNILIKRGAADSSPLRLRTATDAGGISEVYGPANSIRCLDGEAFIINLSAANPHQVSVFYYLESVSTGLPV